MLSGLTPKNVVLLAAVAAIQFAQGRSQEEIELLAAFFEVVGDNLSLLALSPSDDSSAGE